MITKTHSKYAAHKGGANTLIAIIESDAEYHHRTWSGMHNAYLRRLPHRSRIKSVSITLNNIGRMFSHSLEYPFIPTMPSPPLEPNPRCYLNTIFKELEAKGSSSTET